MIAWITLTDDALNSMTVKLPRANGKNFDEIPLTPVIKVRLRHVIMFGLDLLEQYSGLPPNNSWRDEVPITSFFKYLAEWTVKQRKDIFDSTPTPASTQFKLQVSPVNDFKKSTKRDKTNYIEFKDEKMWDSFQRHLMIQAQADGIANQLDPNFVPLTQEDQELDKLHSLYFFSVLNHVFLTDKGKTIIRKHMPTFNARAAYAEMVQHMTVSTKAHHKKQELMEFLVGSKFGDNVTRTTATHFILLFQEKFRQLDELSTVPEQLTESHKMKLLQNAVHPIEELRKVKITADTNALVTGSVMTYSQYFTLLESAAANYDRAHTSNNKQRQITTHEIYDTDDPDSFDDDVYLDTHEGDLDGGIDIDPTTFFSINRTFQKPNFNKKPSFNKTSPLQPNQNTRFSPQKFSYGNKVPFLPIDLWNKLDSATKDLLKSYSPNKAHTMVPRKINKLDIQDHNEDDDPGISVEHEDSEDSMLQYVMGHTDQDPADIRQVLSASKAKQKFSKPPPKPNPNKSKSFNQIHTHQAEDSPSYQVNMASMTYTISSQTQKHSLGSLVD